MTNDGSASTVTLAANAAKVTPVLQSRTAASSSCKFVVLASVLFVAPKVGRIGDSAAFANESPPPNIVLLASGVFPNTTGEPPNILPVLELPPKILPPVLKIEPVVVTGVSTLLLLPKMGALNNDAVVVGVANTELVVVVVTVPPKIEGAVPKIEPVDFDPAKILAVVVVEPKILGLVTEVVDPKMLPEPNANAPLSLLFSGVWKKLPVDFDPKMVLVVVVGVVNTFGLFVAAKTGDDEKMPSVVLVLRSDGLLRRLFKVVPEVTEASDAVLKLKMSPLGVAKMELVLEESLTQDRESVLEGLESRR